MYRKFNIRNYQYGGKHNNKWRSADIEAEENVNRQIDELFVQPYNTIKKVVLDIPEDIQQQSEFKNARDYYGRHFHPGHNIRMLGKNIHDTFIKQPLNGYSEIIKNTTNAFYPEKVINYLKERADIISDNYNKWDESNSKLRNSKLYIQGGTKRHKTGGIIFNYDDYKYIKK